LCILARYFLIQLVVILVVASIISPKILVPMIKDRWFPWAESMKTMEVYRGSGVLKFLAEILNEQSVENQTSLIEHLQTQFAYEIAIRNIDQLILEEGERGDLKDGKITFNYQSLNTYKLLEDNLRAVVIGNIDILAPHMHTPLQYEIASILNLLLQEISSYPKESWPESMGLIANYFAMPVGLQSIDDLPLTDSERVQIMEGKIVQRETALSQSLEGLPDYFYQRIPNSSLAVTVGPIAKIVLDAQKSAEARYFGLLGLIVVIPLALWLIPSWRSSQYLLRATKAFGRGDLSVRAKIVRVSNLNSLAAVFNKMAEKVENLFNSNIMLTHAVSHELRTPLTRIEFALELFRSETSSASREKQIQRMSDAVSELKNMSTEMLLYAQFDREKPDFNLEAIDITQWIIDEKTKWHIEPAGLTVSVIPQVDTAVVQIEPFYLSRAVDNLVRNATKYANQCVHVQVDILGDSCLISVENDGPPIADEDKVKVFEPFVRVDQSRTRDSGGAGLGLAIVQQIVNWHHGNTRIENSRLGGAKVVIALPLWEPVID
jgi:signal transduction histidine kinase